MKTISKVLVAAAALAMGACSFEVTNPGPVADAALDDPGAFEAIVRGVQYNVSRSISINAFYSAVAAKEYSTAGRVNATKLPLVFGQLDVDDLSANTWTWSHAARWTAESGVRRLRDALGAGFASNKFAGQLLMYAALTNRVLGECMCEAVIDGGPAEPHTVYLTRAEGHATEAVTVATAAGDLATVDAARAVLASVQLYLGNFAAAAATAALVTDNDFELNAPFDEGTQNLIVSTNDFAVGGNFRAATVWRTFFEDYFRTSGDMRVWWDSSALSSGIARDGEFTGIIWFYPRKYIPTGTTADRGSAIRLTSGREMRLIEAEVALRGGDFATAAGFINGLHAGVEVRPGSTDPLPDWPITNVQEGWDALRWERSIELWLEARTMGDLRRWIADGTYPAMFTINPANDVADRIRLCLPISRGERQNNPNLSLQPNDPESPIFNGTIAPW